jgi:hypothetical protein
MSHATDCAGCPECRLPRRGSGTEPDEPLESPDRSRDDQHDDYEASQETGGENGP